MPKDKDLKRRVRERMTKTGESYTAARAQLLTRRDDDPTPTAPDLPEDYAELAGKTDEVMAEKTGRAWPEWVALLDALGATEMDHTTMARHVGEHVDSGWWAQTITVGYERIRGLREVGQRRDGAYEASRSRTVAVPVERLYRAFIDEDVRGRWLDVELEVRRATPNRSIRITWPDGTDVVVGFAEKGADRSQVSVQHAKLKSREALEEAKAFWGERLDALKGVLQE